MGCGITLSSCGINLLVDADGNAVVWYTGDAFSEDFNFTNPDGTPFDITALTLNAILKHGLGDDDRALFDKPLTVVNAVAGTTTLDIVVADLDCGGEYLLEIYDSVAPKTIAQFIVSVKDTVRG